MKTKEVTVKKNPIFPGGTYEGVELSQAYMPTWFIIVFLCGCFYILKKFVYTKDEKRHGK